MKAAIGTRQGGLSVSIMLILAMIVVLTAGCEDRRTSGQGLYLPQGDVPAGRQAFVDLQCHRCHTVAGEELPAMKYVTPVIDYRLGGEVVQAHSYGELVTSIINPTHVVSEKYQRELRQIAEKNALISPMPEINDNMTVSQLIDLVAFLDSRYQEVIPSYAGYPYSYGASR